MLTQTCKYTHRRFWLFVFYRKVSIFCISFSIYILVKGHPSSVTTNVQLILLKSWLIVYWFILIVDFPSLLVFHCDKQLQQASGNIYFRYTWFLVMRYYCWFKSMHNLKFNFNEHFQVNSSNLYQLKLTSSKHGVLIIFKCYCLQFLKFTL